MLLHGHGDTLPNFFQALNNRRSSTGQNPADALPSPLCLPQGSTRTVISHLNSGFPLASVLRRLGTGGFLPRKQYGTGREEATSRSHSRRQHKSRRQVGVPYRGRIICRHKQFTTGTSHFAYGTGDKPTLTARRVSSIVTTQLGRE